MTASGADIGPGAAWRAGWVAFRRNPEPVLVPVLVAGFAWIVAEVVVQSLISATVTRSHPCTRYVGDLVDPTRCGATSAQSTNAMVLTALAFCLLGQLYWAVALRAAHRSLDPDGVRPARALVLPVLGTATVLAVLLTLGIGTGVLPAILVAFLAQSAMAAVVVDGHGPVRALRIGAREVVARPGYALGFACLAVLTLLGGATLLLVGLWPATAVLALAQVGARRSGNTPQAAGVAAPPLGTMAR